MPSVFNTTMDRVIYEQTGYETFTTFALDFEIADGFGKDAIIDTYKGCKHWLSDYKYWTELVLILNWCIWKHEKDDLGPVYDALWREAEDLFWNEYADKPDDTDQIRAQKATAREYYYTTLD